MLNHNNVRMAEQPEKLDFSKDSRGIGNMLEYVIDLLNGNFFSRMGINCRSYDAITTFAYNLLNLISTCLAILCEEILFQCTLQKI